MFPPVLIGDLPERHKVKVAGRSRAFHAKGAKVEHYLHVDFHDDLKDAVSVVGVVVQVVG